MSNTTLVSIHQASEMIGVAKGTLRRWESEGKITPIRTAGNHRRFSLQEIEQYRRSFDSTTHKHALAYARVSSSDQKEDLVRQKQLLELYCASKGLEYEVIEDLGSGINYNKKGLTSLLNKILAGSVSTLIVTHKDRLLRFGAELIFKICEAKGVEVIILNKSEDSSFEEDLTKDVLEIITVFSAKLYGSRSHKNKKLLADLQETALAHSCSA